MTAKQIKNLEALMTDSMVKGYSTEIWIIKKPGQPVSFGAKMVSNLEKRSTISEHFKGKTPLEAYSKLADAMAGAKDNG